jgi:hypothetical protein
MIKALSRVSVAASAALALTLFAHPASADDGPAIVIQGGHDDGHHAPAAGHHATEGHHEEGGHHGEQREVIRDGSHGSGHSDEGRH